MQRKSKIYGLVGFPLGHSFSQSFFNDKFAKESIDASYENFEIDDIGSFMEIFAEFPELSGLNVTIPYKQLVIPYMDEMDSVADEIGAVNVVKIMKKADGDLFLKGYNSDIIGFSDSISPLIKSHHKKALVLGTGGASKAVVCGLQKLGIEPVLVSRKPKEGVLTYQDLTEDVMNDHTVIVNATPAGMYPNVDNCPDIPYSLITDKHLCFDLVYNPDVTLFMKKAAEHGATVKNGLEMLHLQALAAWKIWND